MTVQVEGEWDDTTRNLVEGLDLHDRQACPGCGFHESITSDPDHHQFTFEHRTCPVCAGKDRYGRVVSDRDRKWQDQHKNYPPGERQPSDGEHVFLRPATQAEIDARKDPRQEVSRDESPRERHS